jgi:nitrilase
LEKILSYENAIKETGCKLLALPEAILGCYPKGTDFGTRLGYRTPEGREDFLE